MDINKRVIYGKNPLVEVILQVKFPTILSINSNEPAAFQDAIRQEYPIYQLAIENQQAISVPVGGTAFFPQIIQQQQQKNHQFISADGEYKVNLTSGYISLSTLNYSRWEVMLSHFENPFKKFLELYYPPFLERVGLRYIDAFSREELGLNDKEWRDLIQPAWLGAIPTVEEKRVFSGGIDIEYLLDNDVSRVKVHAGLGNINGKPEQVYIIDSDFIHIDNVKTGDFFRIVEYLHDNSGRFIRSTITETLHLAMIPGELT